MRESKEVLPPSFKRAVDDGNTAGQDLTEWTSKGKRKGVSRVCATETTLREQRQRMTVRMSGYFRKRISSRVAPQDDICSCPGNVKIAGTGFFYFPDSRRLAH